MENHSSHGSAHSSGRGLHGLEEFFDTYLHKKAPFQLPAKARQFIVQYGPWISLILLILGAVVIVPLVLIVLGLTAVTLPFQVAAGTAHSSLIGTIHMLLGLVVLIMEGAAIPGLLRRHLSGWHLVYYAALLSALSALLSLDIVGLVVELVISMYILFQIREYYH